MLKPRPDTGGGGGGGIPALAAHLGATVVAVGTTVPYGTQQRTALEERTVAGLLAHFQGSSIGLESSWRSRRCRQQDADSLRERERESADIAAIGKLVDM